MENSYVSFFLTEDHSPSYTLGLTLAPTTLFLLSPEGARAAATLLTSLFKDNQRIRIPLLLTIGDVRHVVKDTIAGIFSSKRVPWEFMRLALEIG